MKPIEHDDDVERELFDALLSTEHLGGALILSIRRNSDGLVRELSCDWKVSPAGLEYLWREGNYRCDCNRALCFAQAAGEPDPNARCGEHDYSIVGIREQAS